MLAKLLNWVKRNQLTVLLFLVLLILLFIKPSWVGLRPSTTILRSQPITGGESSFGAIGGSLGAPAKGISGIAPDTVPPATEDFSPQADVAERMVIQESYLSLLVKNVAEVRKQIISYAQSVGGYMVNTHIESPADAPTATIVIRVPSETLAATLDYLRNLSVKVVSENLTGWDVTDQYIDYEKRIEILENTKAKFESILAQAIEISDITSLNREIISLQNQIDSLKGQQEGLSKRAELAKLTIYLATDEIALPYAPSEAFRPNIIFKLAVRSLVGNLRQVATWAIWIGVYAVIWLPVLLLIWWWKKRVQKLSIKK